MSIIKYRQRLDSQWHYWGFVQDGGFVGPIAYSSPLIQDPRISQQYLGLEDINGHEIYSGDIVENVQHPGQYTVARGCPESHNLVDQSKYYRVAGNMTENSELME